MPWITMGSCMSVTALKILLVFFYYKILFCEARTKNRVIINTVLSTSLGLLLLDYNTGSNTVIPSLQMEHIPFTLKYQSWKCLYWLPCISCAVFHVRVSKQNRTSLAWTKCHQRIFHSWPLKSAIRLGLPIPTKITWSFSESVQVI